MQQPSKSTLDHGGFGSGGWVYPALSTNNATLYTLYQPPFTSSNKKINQAAPTTQFLGIQYFS